jgi:hypothetical protein
MFRCGFVALSAILLLAPSHLTFASSASTGYLQQLVNRAEQLELYRQPYWHKLLHYYPDLIGSGVTSQVDSPVFFIAENGKTDPKAELAATLKLFLAGGVDDTAKEPVACRFIARYTWLNEQLHFDEDRIPVPVCNRFDTWLQRINPRGMTLIFPTAYMNNPSSMFGHTLLRIDARGQTEKTRLLAYSANFAANTGNDGGVLFAVKGLLGGYPGAFSIAPYYLKVREYNDLENRDIWEYELNFTVDETRRMLRHLWELRGVYFNYFFFDENCSYHLLALLQTARPGLDLTGGFDWFAIPSDTVKKVVAEQGLVRKTTYRPSRYAELKVAFNHLTDDEANLVNRLATGDLDVKHQSLQAIPLRERAQLLELAYELLNYRMQKDGDPTNTLASRGQQLLLARSEIDVIADVQKITAPKYRPDQGHGSSQMSLIAGEIQHEGYLDLQYRPAYHDLMDPDAGYLPGAQIMFFNTVFRAKAGNVRVEEFTAVDIVSLNPRSQLQNSMSFKFNAGADRLYLTKGHQPLALRLNGGLGWSWPVANHSVSYLLMESTLDLSGHLTDNYSLGIGPGFGIISGWNSHWKSRLTLLAQRFALGETYTRQQLELEVQRSLGLTGAINVGVKRYYAFNRYWTESQLAWQWYF